MQHAHAYMRLSQSAVVIATVLVVMIDPASAADVDFVQDIRPILQKNCVKCHGAEKQEAGLRLDLRTAALAGGDSGFAIVAGKSGESDLVERVASDDPDIVMPPEGDRLAAKEIDLIRAWIDQGAKWPRTADSGQVRSDHWSYQDIVRHEAPQVRDSERVRNLIDSFIQSRLDEHDVSPSSEADRMTLIRRLYLDLIGLPPSPEEVDAFVADKSVNAYGKLVDRLLDSEHFGERWGRHWLDLARYADSDGFEKDRARPNAWRWRDWVVNAVNRDMPFDQFTIEQLAGDLLPEATEMQRLATAFHRQTLTNTEGGTDQEQFRVDACFDRIETTGSVWLGLTIGCARCHSHKYDAITQREYYGLFAFVNNGDETNYEVPTDAAALAKYKQAKKVWDEKLAAVQNAFAAGKQKLGPELAAWEADFQKQLAAADQSPVEFHTLTFDDMKSASGATFTRQDDASLLVEGKTADKDEYTLAVKLPVTAVTGIRIETIPDEKLPGKGAGRAQNGNFVLSDLRVYFAGRKELKSEDAVKLTSANSDFAQDKFPAQNAIDADKSKTGWAVAPQMAKAHSAEFLVEKPLSADGDAWIQVVLDQQYGGQHTIGRFRVSVRTGSDPRDGIPDNVLAILKVENSGRTDKQKSELIDWYATQNETTSSLLADIDATKKSEPKRPYMQVRVVTQRKSSPRTTFVFRRGEFLNPLKDREIIPAGLTVLPELQPRNAESRDRLDLAYWLVSDRNPLTPRVTVNHVWKHLFGEGIVRTVNDFGIRGEKPTHPKLLDRLAVEFRDTFGWSRKTLIRLIVDSATYRQSAAHRPELSEVDPRNYLLARQNRTRVEAEIVRDISLSVGGLLSGKVGGPSVFPPLPPGISELSYANNFKWNTSKGADRYRRGMYTFFKRTAPHPNLTSFDCPDANTACVKRQSSNTPLQALILLNNSVFVDAAKAFAARLLRAEGVSDAERLDHGFRLCVSRSMTGTETAEFLSLLEASRGWYSEHADDAKIIVADAAPKGVEVKEAAAWIATCRVMLNMDEFITRN